MRTKITIQKQCQYCGSSFRVYPSGDGRKFCTPDCYRKSRRRAVIDNGDGTATVHLTQGAFAIIDSGDIERVAKHNWCLDRAGNMLDYAMTRINNKTVRLHRFVSSVQSDAHIDHINGNGLDNRTSNLRICTHRENLRNQRLQESKISKFKGVSRNKGEMPWRARIHHCGAEIHIGSFDSQEEAARAYDAAAIELHGEFAHLNFPRKAT